MKISPLELQAAVVTAIRKHPKTAALWWDSDDNSTAWTIHLTEVIGDVFERKAGLKRVHRGYRDEDERSEYLNIDVMGYSGEWGQPIAICELENQCDLERLQHSLWKLLAVRAEYRALFGYYNDRARLHPTSAREVITQLAKTVGAACGGQSDEVFITLARTQDEHWVPEQFIMRGDTTETVRS